MSNLHSIELSYGIRSCPLKEPYELSFATLNEFTSVWVRAKIEDQLCGIGEAVALPGYSWETTETIYATIKHIVAAAPKFTYEDLIKCCRSYQRQHPFAVSAIVSALEMREFLKDDAQPLSFRVNFPVSSSCTSEELDEALNRGLKQGYEFLKVKIGKDVISDLHAAEHIITNWSNGQFKIVFDANQSYTVTDALEFAKFVEPHVEADVLWFEQPLARNRWDELEYLCKSTRTPIVLDESIYSRPDVIKAARIGVYGVKLKLCKHFGVKIVWAFHGRTNGWAAGQTDGGTHGRSDERTAWQADERWDGRTDDWRDGRTDGRTIGRTDE